MRRKTTFPVAPSGEVCSRCGACVAGRVVTPVIRYTGDVATLDSIRVYCIGTGLPINGDDEDQRPCSEFGTLGRKTSLKLRGRGDAFEKECLAVELPAAKRAAAVKK